MLRQQRVGPRWEVAIGNRQRLRLARANGAVCAVIATRGAVTRFAIADAVVAIAIATGRRPKQEGVDIDPRPPARQKL
eukprot:10766424-Alexandrium_andersonii.AAC.1